jgi:tetratricopeptide (TPR) repeat protein
LEALQLAEQYYRKALSLRPQDPEIKEKQAKARSLVEEKQFFSYLELAQQAVAEQPDSITALQVAENYLSKALILRPNDPEVADQRDLAREYLAAQAAFKQSEWDDVITNLEAVIAKDQGYAKGTAMQSLYEAYVARGDSLMAIGSFDQALADFQRAAVLAEEHSESKLRLYEIQLKIADALGVTGEYEQAVKLYRAAIELANLRQGAVEKNITAMETALADAEEYVSQGNFRQAFSSYRAAVAWATQTFEMVEHTVDSDDYLSSIALEYGSTVSLIAEANNIANPNIIIPGQVLLIPILP